MVPRRRLVWCSPKALRITKARGGESYHPPEGSQKVRIWHTEARRRAHPRLEWVTPKAHRGESYYSPKARIVRTEGSPRLVEGGTSKDSRRNDYHSPRLEGKHTEARRGAHRRLGEGTPKLRERLTEAHREHTEARREAHRTLEWYTQKCHVYHSIPLCTILVSLFRLFYI
jgi:hypothetical protein